MSVFRSGGGGGNVASMLRDSDDDMGPREVRGLERGRYWDLENFLGFGWFWVGFAGFWGGI